MESAELAPNTVHFSDSIVFRIASFLGIIVASVLPVMAIVVLYRVGAMATRLGLVGAFTTIFSVSCTQHLSLSHLLDFAGIPKEGFNSRGGSQNSRLLFL